MKIFIETSQSLLVNALVFSSNWENLLNISKHLINVSPDKKALLSSFFIPEVFNNFYSNTNPWLLFNSLVGEIDISDVLNSNTWLLAKILGFSIVPCLATNLVLYSYFQKYVSNVCNPLISKKVSENSLFFIENLIKTLLDISKEYPAYRVVLMQYLKLCIYNGNERPN